LGGVARNPECDRPTDVGRQAGLSGVQGDRTPGSSLGPADGPHLGTVMAG